MALRRAVRSIFFKLIKINQLHAVSRTQQVRQTEPTVKTLRSSHSDVFMRHCVLGSGTQRCALPRHQSEEMKI